VSHDLIALAGAYVLDALEDDERATFEQHLKTCPDCAEEVHGLQAAAAELSHLADTAPPPDLRASVLAGISQTRPLPPETDNVVVWRRSRASRWAAPALAVAAAVLLVVVGGWGYGQHQARQRAEARTTAITSLLTSPDAAAVTGRIGSDGTATVVYSRSAQQMVFVADGLRKLDASKTYQLWTMDSGGHATSAGIFKADSHGHAIVKTSAALTDAATFGLSVENAGGASTPTLSAVVTTIPL